MSVVRLVSLALAVSATALPALASEQFELRGRLDADYQQGSTSLDESPAIMPRILITERSQEVIVVKKPVPLRYLGDPDLDAPARLAAERVGQDPDRVAPSRNLALRIN